MMLNKRKLQNSTMIEIDRYDYQGSEPGARLVVFGAIHGCEPTGAIASQNIIRAIEKNMLPLRKGSLTLVPVCNPDAYAANERALEGRLDYNRKFGFYPNPQNEDEKRIDNLANLLLEDRESECQTYFLDIHALWSSNSEPFMTLDIHGPSAYAQESAAFAKSINFPYVVMGWPEAYDNDGADSEYRDTNYFSINNNIVALTIECKNQADPESPQFGKIAILRGMMHMGLINFEDITQDFMDEIELDISIEQLKPDNPQKYVWIEKLHRVPGGGGFFSKEYQNFSPVAAGEVIFKSNIGSHIVAPENGYLLFPKLNRQSKGVEFDGQELFYFVTDYQPS